MRQRILTALAGATLVLTLLGGIPAKAADAPASTYPVEVVRADFDELYQRLRDSHYDLYARRSPREYDAKYRALRDTLDTPMTRTELETKFQTLVAFGNIAHARIDFPAAAFEAYRAGGGKVLPLFVRVFEGKVYVTDNYSGLDTIARGDELVALDGQPIAEWLARLRAHQSADNAYMAHTLLEQSFSPLLWLDRGPVDAFEVTVRRRDGSSATLTVPARSRPEMQAAAKMQPSGFALDWHRREARMLDHGVAYLRPGPFYNNTPGATDVWDTAEFSAFIDAAFAQFIAAKAGSLIIDLRDNPGGDNSFSDLMVRWFAQRPFRFASAFRIKASQAAIDSNRKRLGADDTSISHRFDAAYRAHRLGERFAFEIPEVAPREGQRFEGKVYLLINRHSYSNTVMVAALAQDLGFATILGEETADLATTYGAMEQFELSRTGITVGFPKAHIVRPSGATQARGVIPDIAIETPIVATAQDSVLARAIEIAAAKP